MIVIVTGMHRSGTSALAGLLHTNGICMGETKNFLPPPSYENPKGFFENYRFRSVNDHILSENNYSIKTFSPMTPDNLIVSKRSKDIMHALIYEYDEHYENWGWKDPRTCLTYEAWEPFLKEPYTKQEIKTVLMQRDFNDIATSMILRRNFGTRKQFIAVAKEYYRKIFSTIHFYDFTAIIEFQDLIYNPKQTASWLSEKLNWEIIDTSFIDPKISKTK